MNQLKAFDKTIEVWEEFYTEDQGLDPSLTLAHAIDMQRRITPDFSEAKLGRWLGWIQAAAVANGIGTLETYKTINMESQ